MKLIKFTSILLCFFMITAMFAGCNAPDGNKTDVSKNDTGENISVIPEEVSTQESEVLEKIEPWGMDEDWDFLKGWPVHQYHLCGIPNTGWDPYYINYPNELIYLLDTHREHETLFHVGVIAFDPEETKMEYPGGKDFKRIKFEFDAWLKAGNIPLEYCENGFFHGDLSRNDVKKLIAYGQERGFHLFFSLHRNEECLEGKNIYDCDWCNIEWNKGFSG